MAGIDVRVTISAADQGAAAQLEALKKTAAELGVQFTVTADAAGKAAQAAAGMGALRSGMEGLASELTKIAAGYVGIDALREVFTHTIDAIEDAQQASLQLNAAIRATGSAAGLTAEQIKTFSESMQSKTLFSTHEIEHAAAVLMTFKGISGAAFEQTLQYAADISSAFGEDLQGTVLKLGRALEDPIRGTEALRRVGIQFTEEERNKVKALVESGDLMEAQGVILDKLKSKFAGTGEELNKGLLGSIGGVKKAWSDLLASFDNPHNNLAPGLVSLLSDVQNAMTVWRQAIAPRDDELVAANMEKVSQILESEGLPNVRGQSPAAAQAALAGQQGQIEDRQSFASRTANQLRGDHISNYVRIQELLKEAASAQDRLTAGAEREASARTKAVEAAKKSNADAAAEAARSAREEGLSGNADSAVTAVTDRMTRERQAASDALKLALIADRTNFAASEADTRAYYTTLAEIEYNGLQEQIRIRAAEASAESDPDKKKRLRDTITQLQEAQRAVDAHVNALETEALDSLGTKQGGLTIEGIGKSEEGIRSELGTRVEGTRAQVTSGAISRPEGARELADAYAAALAQLRQLYDLASAFAATSADPKAAEMVQELADSYARVQAEEQKALASSNEFARSIGDAVGRSFEQAFDGALDKTRTFADRMRETLLGLVRDLEHAVTAPIGQAISRAVTNALAPPKGSPLEQLNLGPLATILPLLSGDAVGLPAIGATLTQYSAAGGPVYGPGTSTSDSIPARLSAGEHVLTAQDVQHLGGHEGVYALRDYVRHNHLAAGGPPMRIPTFRLRSVDDFAHARRFSSGGAVGLRGHVSSPSGAARGSETHHVIDLNLPEGFFAEKMESKAGEQSTLKVIARNRDAARRGLGIR